MFRIIAASIALAAVGLAGCASSGPTYTARRVQLADGQPVYQVTCYGLFESGSTCRRKAQRICAHDRGGAVRELEGVSVADRPSPDDPRVLRFACGSPAPAAAAPAAPLAQTVQRLSLSADANFDTAQATLRPAASARLDRLIAQSAGATIDTVAISGYTDSRGTAAYNLDLSKRRAQAVADYLASHGLKAREYDVHGYGDAQPVASNASAGGRALNRRVEIVIAQQAALSR